MKEMRKYCVGRSRSMSLGVLILIISFAAVLFAASSQEGVNTLKYAINYARPVLYLIVISVIVSFIFKVVFGNSKKRFEQRITEFRSRGILDLVIEDFKNAVPFFKKGKVKIGRYCMFLKGDGLIFLYEEISSVRMNIVKVSYEDGTKYDCYVPQICVGGKYYNLGQLKTDLNDPQWRQFSEFIRLKAPHIIIENTPYVTTQYISERDTPSVSDDD